MKILWIDDEIDLLRPFVLGLRSKGYRVETATNGPDGLELLQAGDFDLVLLDQIMSGMAGLDVLKRVKEIESNVLVTMVTKSDEEALVDDAYGELVDDFLIKPFTSAQLLAVIKRLLEKRRLVVERVGRQYTSAMAEPRELSDWKDWVNLCRVLDHWQAMLNRYGDEGLLEVQEDRWRQSDEEFSRFAIDSYQGWVRGDGPLLSHRLLEDVVRPLWEEKQTYFILLDAMRSDQWSAIAPLLREYFEVDFNHYFSLLPTATPYSRNAIFSGLLPLDIIRRYPRYWVFEETGQNRFEKELLAELLARLRFRDRYAFYKYPTGTDIERGRGVLLDSEVRFTVIVLNLLDQLIHSIQGTRLLEEMIPDEAALASATRVWFASSFVFQLLKTLARRDCRVVMTSDHGFLRVKRPVQIHGGREMSANLRYKHGAALRTDERKVLLLHDPEQFMLPVEHRSDRFAIATSDYYFIYPTKPREYERTYKHTYQHGGISLREMIVPCAVLTPR